jgi:hypothetical protein
MRQLQALHAHVLYLILLCELSDHHGLTLRGRELQAFLDNILQYKKLKKLVRLETLYICMCILCELSNHDSLALGGRELQAFLDRILQYKKLKLVGLNQVIFSGYVQSLLLAYNSCTFLNFHQKKEQVWHKKFASRVSRHIHKGEVHKLQKQKTFP